MVGWFNKMIGIHAAKDHETAFKTWVPSWSRGDFVGGIGCKESELELLSTRILNGGFTMFYRWDLAIGLGLPQQELSSGSGWEESGGSTWTILHGYVPDGMYAEMPEHSGLPGHCGWGHCITAWVEKKKTWGQATRVWIWKDVKSGSWESAAGATANLHLKRVCWLEVDCRPANHSSKVW